MNHPEFRRHVVAVAVVGLAAVGFAGCGSSSSTTSPTTASAPASKATASSTAAVKIVNFTFSPMSVTVKVGGTVTWTQVDSTGHSVESSTNAWPTSKVLSPGQTFSHKFVKAGTYPYICGVHNYMKGTVTVVG